jgi:hypothetical protein
MHIFGKNENKKNIIEAALFDQNFICSQTIEVQKEIFVMIQADCQLYLTKKGIK